MKIQIVAGAKAKPYKLVIDGQEIGVFKERQDALYEARKYLLGEKTLTAAE